jgi:hypothetical protein
MLIYHLILSLFLSGCAFKHVINNKVHVFERVPKKIVWFQVPGLAESHFVYLKLVSGKPDFKIAPEEATCFGKHWGYSLYSLRMNSEFSLLTELTQSKDLTNSCSDYLKEPFWENILDENIKIGVLDIGDESEKCSTEKKDFFSKVVHLKMSPSNKSSLTFHQDINTNLEKGKTYFDISCKKGRCYSSVEGNVKGLYKNYFGESSKFIFIVRDFSLEKLLAQKKFSQFAEKLGDLNYLASYFFYEAEKDEDLLVLVSGTNSRPIELPGEGFKFWKNAQSTGSHILYKRSSLLSPIMAKGAAAENFCGIFEESEIVKKTY